MMVWGFGRWPPFLVATAAALAAQNGAQATVRASADTSASTGAAPRARHPDKQPRDPHEHKRHKLPRVAVASGSHASPQDHSDLVRELQDMFLNGEAPPAKPLHHHPPNVKVASKHGNPHREEF